MSTVKSFPYVWVIMLVLSVLFLVWTSLVFAGGSAILEQSLGLAGSSMVTADMDRAGLGFLTMAMRKPLWEEVWIGILGIYCALGLRRKDRHAWVLSLFWGIMLITNAAIQGGYEVIVLNWPGVCLQTYLFLVLGTIAVLGLLVTRKEYSQAQPRRAT